MIAQLLSILGLLDNARAREVDERMLFVMKHIVKNETVIVMTEQSL